MKTIPTTILTKWLENHYGDEIEIHNDEWLIPSIANPTKKKLYVNIEKGMAIDFISNIGYNSNTLIGAILGLEGSELYTYLEKLLFDNLKDIDLNDFLSESVPKKKKLPPPIQKIEMPEGCINLLKADTYWPLKAKKYLQERGFTDWHIEKYHLSFCTEGRYKKRIIIPFIENNQIIYWQGRTITKWAKRYDNPVGIEKSMIVYNLDAIQDVAIICEGPFDAMTVDGQAICGVSLSGWQAWKIASKNPKKVILLPDNDWVEPKVGLAHSPGYRGALRSFEKLLENNVSFEDILIAETEGKDLNEIGAREAQEVLKSAQPMSLSLYVKFKGKQAESKIIERCL